ncbi:MAG: GNAT family N-acetyltransferase [Pseudomonadota bacterium]
MFVRTKRLTLRPGWIEDAPELALAIGHEAVVRNLSRAPWPYALSDAESFLANFDGPMTTRFLISEHRDLTVRLIGCIGIEARDGGQCPELGYWITPDAWGRGYATEAGQAVLQVARALGIRRLEAGHFVDNPASGRVLRKLGFRPTGDVVSRHSRGRGTEAACAQFEIELAPPPASGDPEPELDARMAA